MVKIEAATLEQAYKNAACSLKCSVTELKIEVAQVPSKGFLGLFKKNAIIVAIKETKLSTSSKAKELKAENKGEALKQNVSTEVKPPELNKKNQELNKVKHTKKKEQANPKKHFKKEKEHTVLNDTIMPASFVSIQDDEDEYDDVSNYLADYDEEPDFCEDAQGEGICGIVEQVKQEINSLFTLTCFKIEAIDVRVHDENTLLIEFKGDDAALLIGKEGYRYKALSYMIFNWINTKYQVQLRLEIAEFLRNQEAAIEKYLVGVCANIEKDGRAQTKILDGVLIQIALG
ncbi:MAG: Jag N-terminal domain-containing protein, partial [Sulfurimonas sp.]|nr:Jag N-terminal domain-containing protein [Sulfurimonas sp.]